MEMPHYVPELPRQGWTEGRRVVKPVSREPSFHKKASIKVLKENAFLSASPFFSSHERGYFITDLLRYHFSIQNTYSCIFIPVSTNPIILPLFHLPALLHSTAITVRGIWPWKSAMLLTKEQTQGNTVNKSANPETQYHTSGKKKAGIRHPDKVRV